MSTPIQRTAARVLLIDQEGRILLFRGRDPARPTADHWWITPGGGVEPGETLSQAARREVQEETGQVLPVDLGEVVLHQVSQFWLEGVQYEQSDHYFVATAEHSRVDHSGWTEVERRTVHQHHWWTTDELRRTTETIYPPGLLDLLTRLQR